MTDSVMRAIHIGHTNRDGVLTVDSDCMYQGGEDNEYSYTIIIGQEMTWIVKGGNYGPRRHTSHKFKTGWVDLPPHKMLLWCKREFGCYDPAITNKQIRARKEEE